jgi:hypothetical protein
MCKHSRSGAMISEDQALHKLEGWGFISFFTVKQGKA